MHPLSTCARTLSFAAIFGLAGCGTPSLDGPDSGPAIQSISLDLRPPSRDVWVEPDVGVISDTRSADAFKYLMTEEGCLTQASAVAFCNNGDGELCAFSTRCGFSKSVEACAAKCPKGAGTTQCHDAVDMACLLNAMHMNECSLLPICDWEL